MAKKLTALLFLLLCVGGVYGGIYTYRALQNTPEQTAQGFVQELQAGEADAAYGRFAPDLTRGRNSYWRDFLKQFKVSGGQARLVSHEQLKDTFNTYAEHAAPERFTFILKRANQNYQLTMVVLKIDKHWLIGELSAQML